MTAGGDYGEASLESIQSCVLSTRLHHSSAPVAHTNLNANGCIHIRYSCPPFLTLRCEHFGDESFADIIKCQGKPNSRVVSVQVWEIAKNRPGIGGAAFRLTPLIVLSAIIHNKCTLSNIVYHAADEILLRRPGVIWNTWPIG